MPVNAFARHEQALDCAEDTEPCSRLTKFRITNILAAKFMAMDKDKIIRDFLAGAGRKGGKARAARHDKATLSKWAKKGGRPPKKERKR
jgi:general stress protein YciG